MKVVLFLVFMVCYCSTVSTVSKPNLETIAAKIRINRIKAVKQPQSDKRISKNGRSIAARKHQTVRTRRLKKRKIKAPPVIPMTTKPKSSGDKDGADSGNKMGQIGSLEFESDCKDENGEWTGGYNLGYNKYILKEKYNKYKHCKNCTSTERLINFVNPGHQDHFIENINR